MKEKMKNILLKASQMIPFMPALVAVFLLNHSDKISSVGKTTGR